MPSSQYSPHQGEIRLGPKRFAFSKKNGLFGATYTAGGVSAPSKRALERKLKDKYDKPAPKKKPGWFG